METSLRIYNTLSRKKEIFTPQNPPMVGLYVCGPTVYGSPHLGHARPAITFDVVFRYLQHLGYRVRYVRNITDVGHLEGDRDSGEDKISKKARMEHLEPMEIVQRYTNEYHLKMMQLNVLPPSIEPTASGHILEQQELVEKILGNGYAYEKNGSVYFDVEKYNREHHYGKLSGRKTEDLLASTRELEKQEEKNSPVDFALWKNADPKHLMKWPSRWGEGFPGWHLECSAMSAKYLGGMFDIHGGGLDLLFPHHECEIAQTVAGYGKEPARYWMHNNMITLNGQKMGKSLGNAITLDEFFSGRHRLLETGYSPMAIRFFMLQAHYRSTLDFSNEALQAAEKGLDRLFEGMANLERFTQSDEQGAKASKIEEAFYRAMNDDLNTPVAISHLFEGIKSINAALAAENATTLSEPEKWKEFYRMAVSNILGLSAPETESAGGTLSERLIHLLLQIRIDARNRKDFELADKVREELENLGIEIKDTKEGFEWKLIR